MQSSLITVTFLVGDFGRAFLTLCIALPYDCGVENDVDGDEGGSA